MQTLLDEYSIQRVFQEIRGGHFGGVRDYLGEASGGKKRGKLPGKNRKHCGFV